MVWRKHLCVCYFWLFQCVCVCHFQFYDFRRRPIKCQSYVICAEMNSIATEVSSRVTNVWVVYMRNLFFHWDEKKIQSHSLILFGYVDFMRSASIIYPLEIVNQRKYVCLKTYNTRIFWSLIFHKIFDLISSKLYINAFKKQKLSLWHTIPHMRTLVASIPIV